MGGIEPKTSINIISQLELVLDYCLINVPKLLLKNSSHGVSASFTELHSHIIVLEAGLEPARPQWSQDFHTTFAFTRTIFNVTWSDVVVWTISVPY
jgi:hypothetical protein